MREGKDVKKTFFQRKAARIEKKVLSLHIILKVLIALCNRCKYLKMKIIYKIE